MSGSSGRARLGVLAVFVVLAVVGGAAWAVWWRTPLPEGTPARSDGRASSPLADPAPITSAPTSTEAKSEGAQVAAALKQLESDPQALVAPGARSFVRGRADAAVPAGSRVVPEAGSWRPDGLGGGVMTVTVTSASGARSTYEAVMVREGAEWKVLATIGVKERRR